MAAAVAACSARRPTYQRDVAPILARRCGECHRPDGVGALPRFDDYAGARTYAQPIRLSVQTRQMPPWGVDDTGLCNRWRDARWLSTEEIATIAKWQESGAPEGEKTAVYSQSPIEAAPFRADATIGTGGVYHPGIGPGGYRCFIADPKLDRDRLMSAIRVESKDPRGVAQVTLFALDSVAGQEQAQALDGQDATVGYACFGSARADGARLIASWSWPTPVLRMPTGTGVRVLAGKKMVLQIHYNISLPGGAFETSTDVGLEFDDQVKEARVEVVKATGVLAPGERYVAIENRQNIKAGHIVAVAPRMHIRGDTMRLTIGHEKRETCLANFDHWHFYNQQLFVLEKPIAVTAKDEIGISCAYGTLGRAKPVVTGDGIDDEECTAYLFVTD